MRKLTKLFLASLALLTLFVATPTPVSHAQWDVFNSMKNVYGHTVLIATTNASVSLTTAINTAMGETVNFSNIRSVLITAETNDARISFGVAASNSGSGLGHVIAAGNSIRLPSQSLITTAYITSKTSGSASTLQVTLEY